MNADTAKLIAQWWAKRQFVQIDLFGGYPGAIYNINDTHLFVGVGSNGQKYDGPSAYLTKIENVLEEIADYDDEDWPYSEYDYIDVNEVAKGLIKPYKLEEIDKLDVFF